MPESTLVSPGAFLTLHYRVALASERAIDTPVVDTFTDRPATLQLGTGQLAPPLEAKLIGLRVGDHVSFELGPDEAYGPRNPELVRKVSRTLLDAESEPGVHYAPGDLVEFATPPEANVPKGASFAGVLKELNDQFALFDFNHPLAGQPLRFEVQIIGVL
jgi:FKBP-type peptidyl-prolyl cis-trans isomerase SlpA